MMLSEMMVIWASVGVHLMWGGVDFSFILHFMAVKDKIRICFNSSYHFSNKVFSRDNNPYNKLKVYYGGTIVACILKRGFTLNRTKEDSGHVKKVFKKMII
jgi:hypothetical protein